MESLKSKYNLLFLGIDLVIDDVLYLLQTRAQFGFELYMDLMDAGLSLAPTWPPLCSHPCLQLVQCWTLCSSLLLALVPRQLDQCFSHSCLLLVQCSCLLLALVPQQQDPCLLLAQCLACSCNFLHLALAHWQQDQCSTLFSPRDKLLVTHRKRILVTLKFPACCESI